MQLIQMVFQFLGTVFFPQMEHGGKVEWLDTFLQKDENGNFPIVDKLVEVAHTYGFDGWFINQETQGDSDGNELKKRTCRSDAGID